MSLPAPRRREAAAAPLPVPLSVTCPQFVADQQAKHARREKWLRGRAMPKTPLQRRARSAPAPTDRFAKTMSLEIVQDRRLPPRCAMALMQIRAWAGRGGWVSTTYNTFAKHLGVTRRQAINLIRDLAEYGYVLKCTVTGRTGAHLGVSFMLAASKTLPPSEQQRWAEKYGFSWAKWVVFNALRKSCGGVKLIAPTKDEYLNLDTQVPKTSPS